MACCDQTLSGCLVCLLVLTCFSVVFGDQKYAVIDNTYMDYGFQSVIATSAISCCRACSQHVQCTAVSFNHQNNTCQLNDPTEIVAGIRATDWISFSSLFARMCRYPWTLYDGHCYLVVSLLQTWVKAEMFCQNLGGHLVDIQDALEEDFIIDMIISSLGSAAGYIWIGLNDRETEGMFVYSSGNSMTFNNFRNGQPTSLSHIGLPENCGVLWDGNGWNDLYCDEHKTSVCERAHDYL